MCVSSPIYECDIKTREKFWCWRGASQQRGRQKFFFRFFFFKSFITSNNEEFLRFLLKSYFSFLPPIRNTFPAGRRKCRPTDGGRVLASVAFDPDSGLLLFKRKKDKNIYMMMDEDNRWKGRVETRCARTDKASAAAQDEKAVDRADLYILLRLLPTTKWKTNE